MHEQKINSNRQHSQKPGFERLIFFFLSFLSSILLCFSFLVALKNWKRHAFSFSLCLIMALFRSALLYKASPRAMRRHSRAAGGLPRLTSTLQPKPPATPANAPAKCSMNVTCFNKCRRRSMPRLNQQEQLLYCADTSADNTSRSLNQVMAIIVLGRLYCFPLIISMKCRV